MSSYQKLAAYYDEFQNAEETREILSHILEAISNVFLDKSEQIKIADLGCGTGEFAIPLLEEGYQISAIDFSPAMLEELSTKILQLAPALQENIDVYEADIAEYLPLGKHQILLCLTDTINHLDEEQVEGFLENVHALLGNDGLFVFDLLNRDYVITERGNQTIFAELGDDEDNPDVSFVWENEWIEEENMAISDFTFFEKTETGDYSRSIDQTIEYIHDEIIFLNRLNENFDVFYKKNYPERTLFILKKK